MNSLSETGRWNLTVDSGTTAANFIGTTDSQLVRFKVNNKPFGFFDMYSNGGNIAIGENSPANVTPSMQTFTGIWNTALGSKTLASRLADG